MTGTSTPASALAAYTHRWIPGSADTVLLLHGTGGTENDLIPLAAELLPGAAVLAPRGNVLEGPMPRFFRRLAEGVFDLEDLAFRTTQLAAFVRAASETYAFDLARLTTVGFSNGANIAASVLLSEPGVLRRAVLFRAMLPREARPPSLDGTRVYIGAGRRDPIIPPANVERLASLLREGGADVTLDWRNAGHGLTREDIDLSRRWLHEPPLAGA
ncbi:MAG TPA: alpha/beta hydrolase [Gemmatimonadaceae bacterium]|nr:alpha/beta hydrolase [Gemmatimonadaceae bacterium]